ncbi:MAG: nucleoside deaminase [Alphaproteobacteria bacterium]|nr:nucleoside deaminase [Alphaproteobacteria bacterium]
MENKVIANEEINSAKLAKAEKIILQLQQELIKCIAAGSGPFLAAIYDESGNLIAKAANSVISETCSHNHAEMNAIKAAEKALNTHDLSAHHLSLYITAEPCLMCLGGIMWSGIKEVYYSVPSGRVEQITGFDEGFKPNWLFEFKKRGITVYGNIAVSSGEKVLQDYVSSGKIIYQPKRKSK